MKRVSSGTFPRHLETLTLGLCHPPLLFVQPAQAAEGVLRMES